MVTHSDKVTKLAVSALSAIRSSNIMTEYEKRLRTENKRKENAMLMAEFFTILKACFKETAYKKAINEKIAEWKKLDKSPGQAAMMVWNIIKDAPYNIRARWNAFLAVFCYRFDKDPKVYCQSICSCRVNHGYDDKLEEALLSICS